MNKKSFADFRFFVSVIMSAFVVFVSFSSTTSSLEFDRMSNILTSLKASSAANHKVQFRVPSRISSGTMRIEFGDLVADKKNVSASDVSFLYGISSSESEYLIQDAPDDGIWGAVFSLNGTSTVLTLTYPTSNGVPINANDNVIIHVGTDPRIDSPSAAIVPSQQNNTTTTTTSQIITNSQAEQVPIEPTQESVPATNQSNSQDAIKDVLNSLSQIQNFINERLAKLRNLVEKKSVETRPESAPTVVANAPIAQKSDSDDVKSDSVLGGSKKQDSSLWSWGGFGQKTTPGQQGQERKYLITLAQPKAEIIDTVRENIVFLERPDGGRLDIYIPEGVVSGAKNISLDVKPMTLEQSREWSKLRLAGDKQPMLAHVYVITAMDDQAQSVTQFDKPIKYHFRFTSKEIEEEGIDPHTLQVYSWDAAEEMLQREPSIVNLDTNIVTAQVYHLTTFLLLGDKFAEKIGEKSGVAVMSSVVLPRVASEMRGEAFGLVNAATAETISFAGSDFYATPNTRLSFCIPKKVFPKPVREITLFADKLPQPFVFNREKNCYSVAYVTPIARGKKSVTIKMVFADDQVQIMNYRVNIIASELQVKVLSIVAPRVEEARVAVQAVNKQVEKAVQTTQPVLQTTAIATGAGVTALNPTIISNSLNWYHYFNHFLSAILSALGLRKRRRPWGVAYNAITKMPIDLAIVRLLDAKNNKLVETQVTDKEGRFSFLAIPGEYILSVTKPPFLFPSKIVLGARDGEYAGVYHDAILKITQANESMNLSIPLDPPNPKEEKTKDSVFDSIKNLIRNYSGASLVVSLVVSITLALYVPSALNSILLFVNSLFVISQSLLSTRKEKEWGTVFDVLNFEPIPLAAISIINAKEGKLLRTRLSDYLGRFSFLSPPGEYAIVVMKENYVFPPAHAPRTRKFKSLYLGGKFIVKKQKAFVKANIPMEKRTMNQAVRGSEEPSPRVRATSESKTGSRRESRSLNS